MTPPTANQRELSFAELVAFTAAVMALNALAIDMMLPALGLIGEALGAAHDNDRQLVVVVYVVGNGVAQLFFGPFVDRFGRRTMLLWALGGYILGSFLSVAASSFSLLLAARLFQGIATAAARVSIIAVVRDQCSGRRMAEVMSLAITIFMAAPILAPGFGQMILYTAPWRGIFVALLFYGVILSVWTVWRLPETLTPENWKPLRFDRTLAAYGEFVRNRTSLGYTLASSLCFGALFGYISASEQIFLETFDIGQNFAIAFAAIAIALGAASLTNAALVARFGMRRLCHGAIIVFILSNLFHLAIIEASGERFALFMIFMCVSFFCLGLIGPNATAMAMEPMGGNAGPAAAANGFAGTTVAGFLGGVIGRFYDGTTTPIVTGFVVLGAGAFLLILWTEKGQLFHPHHPDQAE